MGKLCAIARARTLRAPMEAADFAEVDLERGIIGDARGVKIGRQITVVFRESWDDACRELGADVAWTARRANLLVEGVAVPRPPMHLRIGNVVLAVTRETDPCSLMDRQHQGLRAALKPEWRGGVCCNVVEGGRIRVGDWVMIINQGELS